MKRISLVLLLALTIGSCQNKHADPSNRLSLEETSNKESFVARLYNQVTKQDKYPDLPNGVYAEIITNKGTFVAKL